MSNIKRLRIYGILATLLLILSAGFGYAFWNKSLGLSRENQKIAAEMQALELEKTGLVMRLDSLTASYNNLRTENEDLKGREASTVALIAEKDAAIKKIKSQNRRNLENLRKQVADLTRIRIEYETIVSTLRAENDQLREENQRLTGENEQLRGENTNLSGKMDKLAKQLEEQIRQTQSARFKASSFRVEVERRHDKLTARAKKARTMIVSFDLADVPEPYQGAQKLYLAVTNDKGHPIAAANPIKTTIQAPTGPVSIVAQQVKQVALNNTQRLSFTYKIDENLKAGNYVVAIYCESGLLGVASLRLA